MSSPNSARPDSTSQTPTYLESVARRVHNTSGKEHLLKICAGGFVLESTWQYVIEPRMFGTSHVVIRKGIMRAAVFWPSVFVITSLGLKWAERTVARSEKEQARRPPTGRE